MAFVFKPMRPRVRPPIASVWARYFARVLDGLILGVPARILTSVADIAFDNVAVVFAIIAVWVVADGLLQVVWLATGGQSPGRRACNVRVVDATTYRTIKWSQAAKRQLAAGVLGVTILGAAVDAVVAIGSDDRRSLHDRFAGTLVVSTDPSP